LRNDNLPAWVAPFTELIEELLRGTKEETEYEGKQKADSVPPVASDTKHLEEEREDEILREREQQAKSDSHAWGVKR
jgi:hypothetical protein